jgi:hypothetical protein
MARLTLLLLVTALALPAAALAAPARENDAALATERYYSSYGEPSVAVSIPEPAPAASGSDGPSWFGAIALGLGLALVAGGLGVHAGRVARPRHLGT